MSTPPWKMDGASTGRAVDIAMAMACRLAIAVVVVVFGGGGVVVGGGGGGVEAAHLARSYGRVFSFGDSLTDTGNAAILRARAGIHGNSGGGGGPRASDGRLVVDFIEEWLGAPRPAAYLAGGGDLRRGANFAVGGATALDPAFLAGRGVRRTFVPISLSNQTTWFHNVLHASSCHHNDELKKMMASTLFYFGELGFNDYTSALRNNGSFAVAKGLVPDVVAAVRSSLSAVIAAGARTVVLTGMMPIGCEPGMLALFPAGGAGDRRDHAGCITRFNELAELHNRALTRHYRIQRVRRPPLPSA